MVGRLHTLFLVKAILERRPLWIIDALGDYPIPSGGNQGLHDPMNTQEEIQHYRNTERRHMISAKNALQSGVDTLAGGHNDTDFVLACVDYLDYIIGRFVEQGRGNTARLRQIVPADDAEDQQTLTDIESTLARTRTELDALIAARDEFRSNDSDIESLTGACQNFLSFYNGTLAQRKDPAQTIVQKHIDPETYWQQTNDVTSESIETEQSLFARLTQLAPDGISVSES